MLYVSLYCNIFFSFIFFHPFLSCLSLYPTALQGLCHHLKDTQDTHILTFMGD